MECQTLLSGGKRNEKYLTSILSVHVACLEVFGIRHFLYLFRDIEIF